MSWTDERVERLGKLWMEGRSASQIATELGLGVSRNAVIGKIHRLGLSGRTASPVQAEASADKPKPLMKPVTRVPVPVDPAPIAQAKPFALPQPLPISDVVIPFSDRVTIMDLRETMCRWPLGDPTSSEFRFCGCRTAGAIPYCSAHARVAFQPVTERRRVDRMARIA